MLLMSGKLASAAGRCWPNTPKWGVRQVWLITCSAMSATLLRLATLLAFLVLPSLGVADTNAVVWGESTGGLVLGIRVDTNQFAVHCWARALSLGRLPTTISISATSRMCDLKSVKLANGLHASPSCTRFSLPTAAQAL